MLRGLDAYHAVHRSSVAALAFVEQDSALVGRAVLPGVSSPLLILTEDRQYHIASPGGAHDAVAADAQAKVSLAQGKLFTTSI